MYDTWNPAELNEAVKNTSGSGNGLPVVDPTDEGKVLTVNSSGEWEAVNLSSGYDITEEEVITNIKIDGRTVYCKKVDSDDFKTTLLTSNTAILDVDETIESVICSILCVVDSNNSKCSIVTTSYIASGVLYIMSQLNSTISTGYLILYYLKNENKKTRRK